MSELLFVAVPGAAVQPDGAVLRVLIVPRLSGLPDTAKLAAYGFADWPGRLAGATFRVERADAVPDDPAAALPPLAFTLVTPPAGIGPTWSEVFPPDHGVTPHQLPGPYPTPRVDQSATQSAVVRGVYTEASMRTHDPAVLKPLAEEPSLAPPAPVKQTTAQGPPEVTAPDFHQVVAMLREHPRVLEGLGLIVELRLTTPSDLGQAGVIRVRCDLPQQAHPIRCSSPWTRYLRSDASAGRFVADAPPGSDLKAGMLTVGSTDWSIETYDVTGAVDRLRDESFRQARAHPAATPATVLPALRSAGLSLMRDQRETQLDRQARGGGRNTRFDTDPDRLVLDAEHLLLGYRVDVRRTNKGWHSLMQRNARYAAAGQDATQAAAFLEEGQVKANAVTVEGSRRARELDGAQLPPLRADEVVVRWDGWSLTCPKPGTLAAQRAPGRRGLPYLASVLDPIGLPTLRFGQTYRMRIRLADAAGGGLGLQDPEPDENQSEEGFYGRHDPVPHPVLVPPTGPAPGPGDQVDVLVIRSDPQTGRSVAELGAQFPPNDTRFLLPPSASWLLVDQHGRFGDHQDPVEPGEPDETTLAAWLARALQPETFLPHGGYSWLPDPLAEGIALLVQPEPGTPDAGTYAREGWTVPSGAWPDLPAKTIALEEPTAQHPERLSWVGNHLRGVVRLRAGEQLVLAVSSTIQSAESGLLALDNWISTPVHSLTERTLRRTAPADPGAAPADGSAPETVAKVLRDIREGRHPMVSPPLLLRFVHAVPHPVTAPQGSLTAHQAEGATMAQIVPSAAPAPGPAGGPAPLVELGVHVPSTGQVELRASWPEFGDDETPQPVADRLIQAVALAPDASALPVLRHEFGDTKHRLVDYSFRAVSRYRDYFPPSGDPDAFAGPALTTTVDILSTARPPAPVVLAVTPAFRWSGGAAAPGWTDVTRVREGGLIRVELARPWNVSGGDEQLGLLLARGGAPLSTIRRDPIWSTPNPPVLQDLSFRNPASATAEVPLPEAGEDKVLVVPINTHFAPGGDLPAHWFADIELTGLADASYGAFVSLVLARYQPHSLPKMHLSPAIRAEPVQLLPTRTLHASRSGDSVTVTLSGLQPDSHEQLQLAPGAPVRPMPNTVQVSVELLPAQAGRPDVRSTGNAVRVGWATAAVTSGGVGEQLTVQLPPGDRPLRLVVTETERLRGGGTVGADELDNRVVFIDVLPLR